MCHIMVLWYHGTKYQGLIKLSSFQVYFIYLRPLRRIPPMPNVVVSFESSPEQWIFIERNKILFYNQMKSAIY